MSRVLQNFFRHGIIIVILNCHQQKHAAVRIAADLPIVEQRIGIIIDGHAIRGIHSDNNNLCAAGVVKTLIGKEDFAFSFV